MNCVYCQSEQVVKNGSKTLKSNQVLQRDLCKPCGRRFNERSGTPMARLRTPAATVEMALNARHEGLGVRAAARVVGKSPICIVILLKNENWVRFRHIDSWRRRHRGWCRLEHKPKSSSRRQSQARFG